MEDTFGSWKSEVVIEANHDYVMLLFFDENS